MSGATEVDEYSIDKGTKPGELAQEGEEMGTRTEPGTAGRRSIASSGSRRYSLLIVAIVLAVVAAACGGDDEAASPDATQQREAQQRDDSPAGDLPGPEQGIGTIRVASLPIPHNVQFIELARFAEKYQLDVEWVSFQRYADTQLAVAQGDVAFAAAGYHTVALDTAPKNIAIVAGGNSGAQALVMREGIEVKDWSDLKGLRIGVAPNSGPDIQFNLAAKKNGFDPASIKRVNFTTMGPPVLVSMRNKEIDGMLCWEVWCAQSVVDGQAYYAPLDIGDNPTGNANTLLLANQEWSDKYPNAATLLVKAYVDAVEFFRDNPDEWVKAVTTSTGADNPEVLRRALGTINLEWELYRERALATARAYAEFGVSKRDMSEEVQSYLNYEFLLKATGKAMSEVGG